MVLGQFFPAGIISTFLGMCLFFAVEMGGGGIYLKSIIYIYILVILIIYIFHIYLYILFYYYTTTNYWRYIPFFLSLNTIRCIGFSPVSPRRLGLSLPHGIVACVRGPFVRNQGSGWWFFQRNHSHICSTGLECLT